MTTPRLLSKERLARIFDGRVLASDKPEILDHIAALEAANAALLEGLQRIRNLLMYPQDEWHQVAAAAIREGNRLTKDDHPGAALLEEHRKALEPLRAIIDGLAHEMDRTLHHRETKGGMSVPDHGDFCNAPASMLGRMRWWVREIREALGGQTSRLLARARNEGLEKAATLLERLASNADMAADAAPNSKIRLEHAVEVEGLRTHAAVVRTMKEPEE